MGAVVVAGASLAVSVWHSAGDTLGHITGQCAGRGKACCDNTGFCARRQYFGLRHVFIHGKPAGGIRNSGGAGCADTAAVHSGGGRHMDTRADEMHSGWKTLSDWRGDCHMQLWRYNWHHRYRSENGNYCIEDTRACMKQIVTHI